MLPLASGALNADPPPALIPSSPNATSPVVVSVPEGSCISTADGMANRPADAGALQKNCAPRLFDGSLGLITTDLPKIVTSGDWPLTVPPVHVIVTSLLRGGFDRLPTLVHFRSSGR